MSDTNAKVLFVDDDDDTRRSLERSVRGQPFDVSTAADVAGALELAKKFKFAAIAVDYEMPGLDGLHLTDKLLQLQPDASYLLISGRIDMDTTLAAVNQHRINFVVRKPWEIDELNNMLHRAVQLHQQRLQQRTAQVSLVESTWVWEQERRSLKSAVSAGSSQMAQALMQALAPRGHETPAHCHRVAAYSTTLGRQMGLDATSLEALERGALLHDLGKVAIPESIYGKRSALTTDEWKVVRSHPEVGARMLDGIPLLAAAQPIIQEHHERWDGSGYPVGLRGEQISLGARIFAVADTLDALSSFRAYHPSRSLEEAVEEIAKSAGKLYDPKVVEALRRLPMKRLSDILAAHPEEGEKKSP